MRTRLFLTLLLAAPAAFSQTLVNCATSTPCTTSGPLGTNTGDPAWLAFGKLNTDISYLYSNIPALPVSVANGGTGTSAPGLVAGSNVTITGSWPNQTINSSGGGGSGLTSVGLTAPAAFTVTGSPLTSNGTIAINYSGTAIPASSGGTGEPGTITGILYGNGTSAHTAATAANVYGLWTGTCSSTTFLRGDGSCQAPSGSGTVTSVGVTSPNFLTASGSPVTASGTIALAYPTTLSAASWTTAGVLLASPSVTLTDTTGTGTISVEAANAFGAPTIAATNTGVTISNLANLYLPAPVAGTNVTATNLWSLYTAGNVRVGPLTVNGTINNANAGGINTANVAMSGTQSPIGNGIYSVGTGILGFAASSTEVGTWTTTALTPLTNIVSGGTTFTIASGCATTSALTGGAFAGSFATTATTCTPVITFAATAAHGYVCHASDITHPVAFTQTAVSSNSCTVSGTTTSGDTVVFMAIGY